MLELKKFKHESVGHEKSKKDLESESNMMKVCCRGIYLVLENGMDREERVKAERPGRWSCPHPRER